MLQYVQSFERARARSTSLGREPGAGAGSRESGGGRASARADSNAPPNRRAPGYGPLRAPPSEVPRFAAVASRRGKQVYKSAVGGG